MTYILKVQFDWIFPDRLIAKSLLIGPLPFRRAHGKNMLSKS